MAVANAQAVTQWVKKVIIERQPPQNEDEVSAPNISIVKSRSSVHIPSRLSSRSRFGSQNTTLTNITEYELPLDISWEFPREQIILEKVIGEGAFGKVEKVLIFYYFLIFSLYKLLLIFHNIRVLIFHLMYKYETKSFMLFFLLMAVDDFLNFFLVPNLSYFYLM